MATARGVSRYVATLLAGGLLLPVVGEFFVEYAREKGLYDQPSARVETIMTAVEPFTSQWWLLPAAMLCTGLAAGLWFDALFRRRDVPMSRALPLPPVRRAAEHGAAAATARAIALDRPEVRAAKAELATFVAQRLLPTIRAQIDLQAVAIQKLSTGTSSIEKMATWGNDKRRRELKEYDAYLALNEAAACNFTNMSFDDLMKNVLRVNTFYVGDASYTGWICRSAGIDYKLDQDLQKHYKIWRLKADDVEKSYRRFVTDPHFPLLWRADAKKEIDKDFITDQ